MHENELDMGMDFHVQFFFKMASTVNTITRIQGLKHFSLTQGLTPPLSETSCSLYRSGNEVFHSSYRTNSTLNLFLVFVCELALLSLSPTLDTSKLQQNNVFHS